MKAKLLINSLQKWLLEQGRCVGCGQLLKNGIKERKNGATLVICSCRRVFVYEPKNDSYRRALLEEVV